MSDKFYPIVDVNFVDRGVIWEEGKQDSPRYTVKIPEFLAQWDVWEYWERERFRSMEENLKQGDVLYEIGVENGWMSPILAKFVGPENMVLFEPSPEFWPNIKTTWEHNCKKLPRYCFGGFASDQIDLSHGADPLPHFGWPDAAFKPCMVDAMKYRNIHEHADQVAQIRIDDFIMGTGIIPRGITIDVEGAEFNVLRGAEHTLKEKRPLVWASLHPDQMLKNYACRKGDIFAFMEHRCGYKAEHLATDHEEHYLFTSEPR